MIKLIKLLEIKNLSDITVDMVFNLMDNELMHTPAPVSEWWDIFKKYNWDAPKDDSDESQKQAIQKIKDDGRLVSFYKDLLAMYNKYKES